ncbi:hypothetical protein GEMRC1_013642 [Eukaryota sp. GEM-RC1]
MGKTFLILSDSTLFLQNWLINNVESYTLFEVCSSTLYSSKLFINVFDISSIFNIVNSMVSLEDISIQECRSILVIENEAQSYFTILDSDLILNNFKFSGCISQSVFKSDFDVRCSSLSLNQSSEVLLLSTLNAQKSSLLFSSGYPIIAKSVIIDEDSEILGSDSFLNLSQLSSNSLLSPTQDCCNTSFCSISLMFDDVYYLDQLLDLSINIPNNFSYNFQLNSLDFFVRDIVSFNILFDSIYINLTIPAILFSDQLFIPICPIEFVNLDPPTRGGLVPLFAFNLGIAPIVIHHSTAPMNQSLEYSSSDHTILNIYFWQVMDVIN